MARKKKFKLKIKKPSPETVIAIILIVAGLVSGLSILGLTRSFLNGFADKLEEFWGWGIVIFPLLSLLSGLYLLEFAKKKMRPHLPLGLALFLTSSLGITSLFAPAAGGVFGKFVARTIKKAFTPTGAFLILLIPTAISLQMILGIPWKKIWDFISKTTPEALQWINEKILLRVTAALRQRQQRTAEESIEIIEDAPDKDEKVEVPQEEEQRELKISGVQEEIVRVIEDEKKNREKVPDHEEKATPTTGVRILEDETPEEESAEEEPSPQKEDKPPSLEKWSYPPISLLSDERATPANRGDIKENALIIKKALQSFNIEAEVTEVNLGPTVTQYALELAEGTKISRITSLQNDLALALAAPTGTVRIEAPIPGKSLVGIEVPNHSPTTVTLKSVLKIDELRSPQHPLTVPLGHDVGGNTVIANIAKWPHMLIAGATGSGKSVLLHSVVTTLLFKTTPADVKLILVDPKRVELTQYSGIPHLLTPVITQAEKVIKALRWAVAEMEKRYETLQEAKERDIKGFNRSFPEEKLPYIIIMVDELADLMAYAASDVEQLICRIAQMSRATGIHLLLSTQRPSVDVITGLIKANIPARIALNVSSSTDSRVIIDSTGAETLLGQGDMLYLPPDRAKPIRIQGVFVSQGEIKETIDYLRSENEEFIQPAKSPEKILKKEVQTPQETLAAEVDDPKFPEAIKVIVSNKKASASLLQRRLSIGYVRAARLLDELEKRGLISPKEGTKARDVYTERVRSYLNKLSGTDSLIDESF